MEIIHTVEQYYPSQGGMQEVVKQISEHLVQRGHKVTVVTSAHPERKTSNINGVNIRAFEISGNFVRGISGEVDKYQNFLRSSNFDIITNFAAQQWATDAMFPLLTRIKAKKVFVPTGFSGLYQPIYEDYFIKMPVWMKEYDMNVFLSNDYRDINFARKNDVTRITVIPNGASEEEFSQQVNVDIREKLSLHPETFLILHVGTFTGKKGHKEALEIFAQARLARAALLMVGNTSSNSRYRRQRRSYFFTSLWYNLFPSRLKDRNKILITELDRLKTVAAFKQADIFLFTSNIECSPLVLFECLASNTPFLTTDVGNAKEIIDWSGAGILVPTTITDDGLSHAKIKESAVLLKELSLDKKRRQKMAEKGFRVWWEKFTWEKISRQYEKLYLQLLGKD